jgi:hypothetical protein
LIVSLPMQSLGKIISALRREVFAALEANRELPEATGIEADRIVASLNFTIKQHSEGEAEELSFFAFEQGEGGSGDNSPVSHHNLTIEFKVARQSDAAGAASKKAEPEPLAGAMDKQERSLIDSLANIFGPPGFDSSARATVFREALTGISDDQARAIIDSLRGMPTPGITPAAARARHLISRLINSGNAGPARCREILAEVFHRHSVQSIIQLVRDEWKTQEEWLGE